MAEAESRIAGGREADASIGTAGARLPLLVSPRRGQQHDGTVLRDVATRRCPEDEQRSKPRATASEGHRDTVEAIVVAFILALVVRGFEAQAFVIPTGSMAPTLMGRHKELACPQCGFVYCRNASEEVEPRTVESDALYSGLCGNCRFQARLADACPASKATASW